MSKITTKKKLKKAKEIVRVKPDYTHVSIINNQTSDGYDTRGEDGPYTGDCVLHHSNHITGFRIVDRKGYNDFVVPFKIEPNTPYYFLYVIHTDGDSFSSETGLIHYIDMYRSEKLAKENAKRIKDKHDRYEKRGASFSETYTVELINDAGKKYNTSTSPWSGYFNSLTSVEVESLILTEE
jgi:hypothetical protein